MWVYFALIILAVRYDSTPLAVGVVGAMLVMQLHGLSEKLQQRG